MIRFSRYMILYAFISGIVLVPGILSLVINGLKPAVDFTGGTLVEVRFAKTQTESDITGALEKLSLSPSGVQRAGDASYLIRFKADQAMVTDKIEKTIKGMDKDAVIVRADSVGPVLGRELLQKTVTAAIIAVIAILSYVAYAFKNIKYGVSAIVALIHDLLVVLGVFSLLGKFYGVEVDTLFVTAFLTTMSFSVHDTIVVFDRIRELDRKGERLPFEQMCDKALTETIGRSLTNSLTIIFMLLALVLMGGSSVLWFAFALLVGTISGTYSSVFVATPVLILWEKWERRKRS